MILSICQSSVPRLQLLVLRATHQTKSIFRTGYKGDWWQSNHFQAAVQPNQHFGGKTSHSLSLFLFFWHCRVPSCDVRGLLSLTNSGGLVPQTVRTLATVAGPLATTFSSMTGRLYSHVTISSRLGCCCNLISSLSIQAKGRHVW